MTDAERATDNAVRVADIRARADAATDGPWVVELDGGVDGDGEGWRTTEVSFEGGEPIAPGIKPGLMLGDHEDAHIDAEFIAAARSDVPWLLERLTAATAEVERVRAAAADAGREMMAALLAERDAETERADKAEAAARAKVFAEVDAALVREAAKPLGDSVRLGIGVARLAVRSQLRNGCPTCSGPIRETVGMVCQTCGTDYGDDRG